MAWGLNHYGEGGTPPEVTNVLSVAAGTYHNLALLRNGTVTAWGVNTWGQGAVPPGLSDIKAIAAGNFHNVALRSNGTVVAWGYDRYGQTNVPAALTNVSAVAAGESHTVALKEDGTVVAWGPPDQSSVPAGLSNVVAIASGLRHTIALCGDGTISGWGTVEEGWPITLPALSDVVAISAGSVRSMALTADLKAVTWDSRGSTTLPYSNLVETALGALHGVALTLDGQVLVWGDNTAGAHDVPLGLPPIDDIAAGDTHTLALIGSGPPTILQSATDRAVIYGCSACLLTRVTGERPLTYQWYKNGTALPGATNAALLFPTAEMSDAGSYFLIASNALGETRSSHVSLNVRPMGARVEPGSIMAVREGSATFTAVPTGAGPFQYQWRFKGLATDVPLDLPGGTNANLILRALQLDQRGTYSVLVSNAAGTREATAQLQISEVAAWGANSHGEGNSLPDLTNVIAVAAGLYHNLALRNDGSIVAWGINTWGQTNVLPGLSDVKQIAAGGNHNLVLKANGMVVAWGYNGFSQTNVPSDLTQVRTIAAGNNHSLALREDGTVVAWGDNSLGQTSVPAGLSNVVAIATGGDHNLALLSNGRVAAWANNNFGQSTPPADLESVIAIGAGLTHSLAVRSDLKIVTWGSTGTAVLPYSNIVQVAGGLNYSAALTLDGNIIVWGDNPAGQRNVPAGLPPVDRISAGHAHLLALASPSLIPVALLLVQQPTNTTALEFTTTTLAVVAYGQGLSYQWEFNGTHIPEGTNAVLELKNVQLSHHGNYRVRVTNALGSILSHEVVLTIEQWLPPTIVQQPREAASLPGGTVTFSVTAGGQSPFSYQWLFGGADLAGATNSTLVLSNVTTNHQGHYTVRVSNLGGEVLSIPTSLRVLTSTHVLHEPSAAILQLMLRSGGTNTFAFDGSIVLREPLVISRDTVVDGYGRKIVISGNKAVRVFEVAPGVSFSVFNLEIRDGLTNKGAGIFNPGGTVVCSNVTFTSNQARGTNGLVIFVPEVSYAYSTPGEPAHGGAIYSAGSLVLLDCDFVENSAAGGKGGPPPRDINYGEEAGEALGGAIYSSGTIEVTNCTFQTNWARGGDGGGPRRGLAAGAAGGAVYQTGPDAVFEDCLVSANRAESGIGPGQNKWHRFFAHGGGILNSTGSLAVSACTIISNLTSGDAAGAGIYHGAGELNLSRSALLSNQAISDRRTTYYQSEGYPGLGGGVYNAGDGRIEDCTIASNQAIGGPGDNTDVASRIYAGKGLGGGIFNLGVLHMSRCAVYGNIAAGTGSGRGDSQGLALGGGAFNGCGPATISLANCTVARNRAVGGSSDASTWGSTGADAFGGGLYSTNGAHAALTNCTLANNEAVGGSAANPGKGQGGNLGASGELLLVNSILSGGITNNVFGTIIDLGRNISSDLSAFLTSPASLNATDPKLADLDDYGGPTSTMALLPGSPAIDVGANLAGIDTDQRGVARPAGAAFDIGAFEAAETPSPSPLRIAAFSLSAGSAVLTGSGPPNRSLRFRRSPDLTHWIDIRASAIGTDGTFTLIEPFDPAAPACFYQAISP